MTEARTPPESLLSAALRLLAARQRGVEELRGRLRKKGFEAGEISNCLRWLEERDLLDDAAFSQALVKDRLNFSPRSRAILKMELSRKGIQGGVAEEAVQEVFQETGTSETSLAEKAARGWVRKQGERVLRELTEEDFSTAREKARRRLYGFLVRRGFRGGAAQAGLEAGSLESSNILSDKD
jgi:regulatory protein